MTDAADVPAAMADAAEAAAPVPRGKSWLQVLLAPGAIGLLLIVVLCFRRRSSPPMAKPKSTLSWR